MAVIKYKNPPQPPSGQGTFSDNLVGVQLVQGGGLTQGNFEFTQGVTEKSNRNFSIGNFSEPISLSTLGIESDFFNREILTKNFKVYPNLDLSKVSNFSTYGSLAKRISVSIQKIINFFPAAIEVNVIDKNYNSGITAYDIFYSVTNDETTFKIPNEKIRNPFDIDYTSNSTVNFSLREIPTSPYRDFGTSYLNYSLFIDSNEFIVVGFTPSETLDTGFIEIIVKGKPFNESSYVVKNYYIKPNSLTTNVIFDENFDEVEKFILNRLSNPIYTAIFDFPKQNEDGTFYTSKEKVTWPLDGVWNLDIRSPDFDEYVEKLGEIAKNMDELKTNLISRFLTTGAFKEFDTPDQKVEKILQIYGRSFDEVKKFIDGLAFINSVKYNVANDVPSELLKNIAATLGWESNISPISETEFLESVFKTGGEVNFSGYSRNLTPTELNYQYYRNIILNSSYLFKSKGTRKSIECLLRLIGAPDALVELNETVYLADGKINMQEFDQQFAQISGGTYIKESIVEDPNVTFSVNGNVFPGLSTQRVVETVFATRDTYPVDDEGYPKRPEETDDYYFQVGAGWFEQTPQHRSKEIVNVTASVFTGDSPIVQTELAPFTYGETYFDRFKKFPYMDGGFSLRNIVDNKKSYTSSQIGQRKFTDAGYNSLYFASDDKLVLNKKNTEIFLNPANGLLYDIWDMSVKFNFPISSQALFPFSFADQNKVAYTPVYPKNFSNQKIYLNPNQQTFFEFAQTFWRRMINVRDRMYISDGKTGGYPTLQSVYWKYLESLELAGIPNNKFSYQKMIDYVQGLGDYWIRLVEQMVPASTIWRTGTKIENSVLNRQKFVYRREYNCIILPIPCKSCETDFPIYSFDCNINSASCSILVDPFSDELSQSFNRFLSTNNLQSSNCLLNSTKSKWYIILKLGDEILFQEPFFDGVGLTDPILSFPSPIIWENALSNNLDNLYNKGFNYIILNDVLQIYSMGCDDIKINEKLYLSIGIELEINCK
jgi:hypothetical protein